MNAKTFALVNDDITLRKGQPFYFFKSKLILIKDKSNESVHDYVVMTPKSAVVPKNRKIMVSTV